ncbi:phage head closure protein [Peribacillus frigoritolerans]|uniref:phage head closure protein n=1 Tax=Peribacillus frigoritolerans TaxID=450367 RepID=UPI00207AC2A1|nr:phage head closure protein [Peribacillus frigoritolerans]USK78960.1 phage head closure protein [Peribacillus frigoritolerans]
MIGTFKHRITFIKETVTESPNGFKEKSWEEVKKTWSNIRHESRSKREANEKEAQTTTIVFDIRYQEVDVSQRIRYENREYSIESIKDPTFEKRFLEITANEVM